MLTAEGSVFTLNRSFEAAGLLGTPQATVNWGDGRVSSAAVTGGTATGNIRVRFDYSLDTSGFFNSPSRRTLLENAARTVTSRLGDNLSAIQPSGGNTWSAVIFHPVTNAVVRIPNLNIAANEILVFVGAQNFPGSQLGSGGPGGIAASGSPDWLNTVKARGQTGALATPPTDLGPWGGTLSFDTDTNWYFGTNVAGLQSNQRDFVTVASHELVHLLGFGTDPSWTRLVSNGTFTGPKARAAHDAGGNVPLTSDLGHWPESLTDAGRKTLMGPSIPAGTRELLTPLDLAALDDIGWDIVNLGGNLTAQHVYADNGTYPITITYTGATIGQFTQTLTTTITNAPPVLTTLSNQTALRDQPLNLTNIGQISDAGFRNTAATPPTDETFRYTINWGDGTATDSGAATIDRVGSANVPTLASFDGSHTYRSTGTFTVTVRVEDDDGGTAQRTFQVVVGEPPRITLSLNRTSIAENAGPNAATLTVQKSGPASSTPTVINLSSSDPSEATVPASVTIAAGATSASVSVNAIDDTLLDGTQTVTLTAQRAGLQTGTINLSVTDVESLTATFSAPSVREDVAAGAFVLTVTRSNTDTAQPLTVNISGNERSRIVAPTTAVIPAGSRQVQIPIQPINDSLPQRSLSLTYRITAAGYVAAEQSFVLLDDEPPLFQNAENRFDVDGNGRILPVDALRVINFLSRRRQNFALDPAAETPNGLFVDVNGDYQVTALDALLIINELSRQARRTSGASGEMRVETIPASPPLTTNRVEEDERGDHSSGFVF
jgi:hypothetical protein